MTDHEYTADELAAHFEKYAREYDAIADESDAARHATKTRCIALIRVSASNPALPGGYTTITILRTPDGQLPGEGEDDWPRPATYHIPTYSSLARFTNLLRARSALENGTIHFDPDLLARLLREENTKLTDENDHLRAQLIDLQRRAQAALDARAQEVAQLSLEVGDRGVEIATLLDEYRDTRNTLEAAQDTITAQRLLLEKAGQALDEREAELDRLQAALTNEVADHAALSQAHTSNLGALNRVNRLTDELRREIASLRHMLTLALEASAAQAQTAIHYSVTAQDAIDTAALNESEFRLVINRLRQQLKGARRATSAFHEAAQDMQAERDEARTERDKAQAELKRLKADLDSFLDLPAN